MIAEFIRPEDKKWINFLEHCQHDFYHLPGYVALAAKHEGGIPVAFYAEEGDAKLLAPMLVQRIPASLGLSGDWYDAVTPYGFPTPVIVPTDDLASLARFLEAFRKTAAEYGIITAFFRLHPLITLPKEVLARHGALTKHGQTVYVDLSLSLEEIWDQTSSWHKKNIKKLLRLGFEVKIDDWSLLEDFIAIYRMTMKRLSASDFYLFPDDYFENLRSILEDRIHLCTVLSPEGEVSAGGLFTAVNGIAQYHLSGTSDKHLKKSPSKLASDAIRRWAKENGNLICHFGGGVGGRKAQRYH